MGMCENYNINETIETVEDTVEYIRLKIEIEKEKEKAAREQLRTAIAAKRTFKWLSDI